MTPETTTAAPSTAGARRPARPTGWHAVMEAARGTTTGRLRGGRLWLLMIFLALPLVIHLVVLIWGDGRGTGFGEFVDSVDGGYLQFALPLALIFLGTAALGDEWEGGTAFYLLGLPLPRWAVVVGRWLVCVGRALLLVLPAVVALYVITLVTHEGALLHYLDDLFWVLVGTALLSLGYAAIFLSLGLALRRPVVAAFIVYILERFVGLLPQGFANLALSYHVRNLLYLRTGEFALDMQTTTVVAATPVWQSLLSIAVYIGLFLGLTTFLLRRKEFSGGIAAPETAGLGG